jgi:hypothetical protein
MYQSSEPKYFIDRDRLFDHKSDMIGHCFSISCAGYKVVNKQGNTTFFKHLNSGKIISR